MLVLAVLQLSFMDLSIDNVIAEVINVFFINIIILISYD